MRGRRRGRNRSLPQEAKDSGNEADPGTTGAVTLIEPGRSSSAGQGRSGSEGSGAPSAPTTQRPMKETISEVVTAQAELDHVLPPPGESSSRAHHPTSVTPPTAARVIDPSATPSVVVKEEAPAASGVSGSLVIEAPEEPQAVAEPLAHTPKAGLAGKAPIDEPPVAEEGEASDHETQAASGNPLPRVMAVANQKGGVGKTTTSVNLGAALAELGFRVLVIDLDPQGNATTGLGIDARNFELSMYDVLMRDASLEDCVEPTSMKNLFVAPATIALAGAEIELVPAFSRELKLKKSIESVIDDFDYVLIDCPPSLGLITVNALAAADEVLVPIQCEYYALEGLSQLMRNVHLVASNLNPKLDISTIVLTMYDARTKLADQVANEVRIHFGSKVCRNVIPRTVRLSEAPSFGQPITAFDPASRGAIAYRELAKEVSGGTS